MFIGCVYRSPGTEILLFFEWLCNLIFTLNAEYKNNRVYIFGDFNINLLLHNSKHSQELSNLLLGGNFFPLILRPTRVTHGAATLIDHIWTNDLENVAFQVLLLLT